MSTLAPGFARVQIDALVACYHRLRDKAKLSHAAALGALGQFLVVYVLLADHETGAIEPGGRNPRDHTGYRHRLLDPVGWKRRTRRHLVDAGLLVIDGHRLVGIDPEIHAALNDTRRRLPDGKTQDRPFVALNRKALGDFVAELRGRDGRANGRLFAVIVLLAGHADAHGRVPVYSRRLATNLGVTQDQMDRSISLAIDAGYVQEPQTTGAPCGEGDAVTFLSVTAIRDRLAVRTMTAPAIGSAPSDKADCAGTFVPGDEKLSSAPVQDASKPQETVQNQSGALDRVTSPASTAKLGTRRPPWPAGPATDPAYAERTRHAVEAISLNAASVRELLELADGKVGEAGRGHLLRRAAEDALTRAARLTDRFRTEGIVPDAHDRDLVDLVAALAQRCDSICRVGMQHAHAIGARTTEDPSPDSPTADQWFVDGKLDRHRAIRVLIKRLAPADAAARANPQWRATAGNWRHRSQPETTASPLTSNTTVAETIALAAGALAHDGGRNDG